MLKVNKAKKRHGSASSIARNGKSRKIKSIVKVVNTPESEEMDYDDTDLKDQAVNFQEDENVIQFTVNDGDTSQFPSEDEPNSDSQTEEGEVPASDISDEEMEASKT